MDRQKERNGVREVDEEGRRKGKGGDTERG